jgi:hypothetical protein
MTNFTIHEHMENGLPPSPDTARPVCKRYAYLTEKLASGKFDDKTIREFHQGCDAQASQEVDPSRPPMRTFWNAMYYPEDRRVRLSYYLGEEPWPGQPRLVKQIRTDYVEFKLEPTNSKSGTMKMSAASAGAIDPAPSSSSAPSDVQKTIEAPGRSTATDHAAAKLDSSNQRCQRAPLLPGFKTPRR